MAKLVLLLVFVCFQFSRSEELPAIEQVKLDLDDEIPFNNQTAPEEVLDRSDEVKLDLDDEIPFNNQTAPDEVLDRSDEEQLNPGPKFNYDWLEEKLSSSDEELNKTESKVQSILDKLIALAELIADYSDEENSSEWDDLFDDDEDDDYSYWDMSKDWSYAAEFKESLKGKDGKEYLYNSIISLLKPKNFKDDKIGQDWSNGKLHPVKRFTSV